MLVGPLPTETSRFTTWWATSQYYWGPDYPACLRVVTLPNCPRKHHIPIRFLPCLLLLLVCFVPKRSTLLLRSIHRPGDSCAWRAAGNRISSKMADAHNFSTGAGGGNDWELVSLTASTYAAAPGPILPLLGDDKADSPPPAVFMSQHFNLPAEAHTHLPGCQEFSPAGMMGNDDDTHLNIPCAKNCERKLDDGLITRSDFWDERKKSVSTLDHVLFTDGSGLGGLISLAAEDQTTMFRSPDAASDTRGSAHHVSADAATDGIVDSAHLSCLTAHVLSDSVAISSGVTCIAAKNKPKIPCEAWWKKTISFLCNNAKESVTFRFIFVAATVAGLAILGQHEKLQLQQLRLQFNVDSEKISCSVGEPLGQVKIGMIVGGSPVAQG